MSIRNSSLLLLFCVFPFVGCGESEEQKVAALLAENEAEIRSRLNLFEAAGKATEEISGPVKVSIDGSGLDFRVRDEQRNSNTEISGGIVVIEDLIRIRAAKSGQPDDGPFGKLSGSSSPADMIDDCLQAVFYPERTSTLNMFAADRAVTSLKGLEVIAVVRTDQYDLATLNQEEGNKTFRPGSVSGLVTLVNVSSGKVAGAFPFTATNSDEVSFQGYSDADLGARTKLEQDLQSQATQDIKKALRQALPKAKF